jgi:hypothetical protein
MLTRKTMTIEKAPLSVWQEWNAKGFIPSPDESESAFRERIVFCQNLEQHLAQKEGGELPFEMNDPKSKELLEEVLPLTEKLYGIQPSWVPLFFSNYQLAPWHGGCAWIFQLNMNTPTAAFLQLRSRFRNSSTFLGIYDRPELIAHELSHVGRMVYQEPHFEEFLAYQSSSSQWRRWLGPIVQSSKESLFFILLLGAVILADFALLSVEHTMVASSWWIKLIPLVVIVLAIGRLIYRQQIFKHCLENLETLYPPEEARHLRYRLLDNEMKQFSHFSPFEIENFMENVAQYSFRWRFLKALYPPLKG